MVKITKVYTKTGDDGQTGLVGGDRISKVAPRVEAFGTVDELNSYIGWCRTILEDKKFQPLKDRCARIQNKLFDMGSVLASPPAGAPFELPQITEADAKELEDWIDEYNSALPELRSFVLPGGSVLNSAFHISRSVCRRTERRVLSLHTIETVDRNILVYLNRLSDLLFVLSRWVIAQEKKAEFLWVPGK